MDNDLRTVQFMAAESGKCEDLYWCPEHKKVFIRQTCDGDHVRWLTASKWQGGYEADCSMRAGLIMRVTDRSGKVLFEEKITKEDGYSGTVAKKEGPFSWEAIRAMAGEVFQQYGLQPYEEWKSWLMADKPGDSKEHPENWLYAMVEYGLYKKLARLNFLGVTAYATVHEAKHNISGKTWASYEIMDEKMETPLALCGYKFEE